MRHDWPKVLLLLLVTFAVSPGFEEGQAGGKDGSPDVQIAATATRPNAAGQQTVTVSLMVRKGWHLYANPTRNDLVKNGKTEIEIFAGAKLADVKVLYPVGKPHEDKILKTTYMVYEDRVSIPATVQRVGGDGSPLRISVKYMVCNENTCRPGNVSLTVP